MREVKVSLSTRTIAVILILLGVVLPIAYIITSNALVLTLFTYVYSVFITICCVGIVIVAGTYLYANMIFANDDETFNEVKNEIGKSYIKYKKTSYGVRLFISRLSMVIAGVFAYTMGFTYIVVMTIITLLSVLAFGAWVESLGKKI
jgi:hypothetical protein